MSKDTVTRPGGSNGSNSWPEPVTGQGQLRRLLILLRREFWEHRGSFVWAPVVAAAAFLVLMAVLLIAAHVSDDLNVSATYTVTVTDTLPDGALVRRHETVTHGEEFSMIASGEWLYLGIMALFALVGAIVAIVVSFYALGAVHDERRDRSILFWRSLPVSDTESMTAKALSAAVVAPGIGLVVTLLAAVVFLGMLSATVLLATEFSLGKVWAGADLPQAFLALLATLPVWLIMALPTIGWLLLCSAWVRSKPFLWAVGTPVAAGLLVSTWALVSSFDAVEPSLAGWFWKDVVSRLLLGTFMHEAMPLVALQSNGPAYMFQAVANPITLVAAAAGIAMIALAVVLRSRGEVAE